jgi:hypothetical protein
MLAMMSESKREGLAVRSPFVVDHIDGPTVTLANWSLDSLTKAIHEMRVMEYISADCLTLGR